MAINETPPSVDYTSRDYYAIKQELIARVKRVVPEWNGADGSDFGLALVEAFAYMGDMSSYYIDRIANEGFLATATQRSSILALAEVYGYAPTGYSNADVTLTFTNRTSAAIELPIGVRVTADVTEGTSVKTVTFTTYTAVSVPPFASGVAGQATVAAYEGAVNTVESSSVYGAVIGTSDGSSEQRMTIFDDPVVSNSVEVFVQSGTAYKKWTQVKHLLDFGPADSVYSVVLDKDNVVSVVFGDGISGAIPTLQAIVRAKYIVGGGTIGNISVALVDAISYVPGLTSNQTAALSGNLSVTNAVTGVGGQDPESSSSIRANAPLFLRAQNRAVTLEDFENLALSVDNCGKAKAVSTGYTSVTVYLAPRRDSGDADATPGLETESPYAATIEWTSLRDSVRDYIADKLLAGTTVTYTIPTYVPVTLNVQYKLDPSYTTAEAESNVKTYIINNFSYFYQDFGSVVTAQDLEFVLQTVPGITKGKVQFLYKTGGSPSLTEVSATNNEILSFAEGSLILEAL
jgi:hypothetical protein